MKSRVGKERKGKKANLACFFFFLEVRVWKSS
jgi:hypothetical protein